MISMRNIQREFQKSEGNENADQNKQTQNLQKVS